jgi:anti-sigma factor RsiW
MTTFRGSSETPLGDGENERAREQRHEVLAELLAAYSDQELPAEMAAQIDAHLLGCARCRGELIVQFAVRDRLAAEPTPAVPAGFSARVAAAIADLSRPVDDPSAPLPPAADPATARRRWHGLWVTWSGWAAAVVLGTLLVGQAGVLTDPGRRPWITATPPTSVAITDSIPMIDDAVANYRMIMAGDLPGRARDLAAVRAAVPFPIEPMGGSDLRLLAAWTTDIRGEPAAALAYRWGDRVIVQYVVSEQLFFRNPAVRRAVAASRTFVTARGPQSVIAWPEQVGGTLLVGDGLPEELNKVREMAGQH